MRKVTGVLKGAAALLALMPWSLSAAAQPDAGREKTDPRGPAAACTNDGPLLVERKYAWPRQKEIALGGTWQLAFGDASQPAMVLPDLGAMAWFETSVPTGVHGALYRADKAPNPYVGLNAKALRWVEDKAWWFRKSFRVPKEFSGDNVRLIFEGVDYYGHYWLNGRYLGRSEGAFGAVKTGASGLRCGGENELVVRVDCAGYKVGGKGGAPWASLVKSELWSGWPLGALDFNTVGLWQPVRLVANRWPCLERPFVRTLAADARKARLAVTVEVCAARSNEAPCEVGVALRGPDGKTVPAAVRVGVTPLEGLVLADLELDVPEPLLWWPVGLGGQPLYEADIVLSRDGKTLDRLAVPFGIRTVERRAGKAVRKSYGGEWTFHVNGQPFFVKGVNWMPIDALGDVRSGDYAWSLRLARDAGIQMIRVWGGGILETDDFYEQCDRLGIMVWQDFPLTCGWKAAKLDRSVWNETVQWHVFRLRNHPSLAFWCGGNEFPPDDPRNSDLVRMMARAVQTLDGTRPFMAASPDEGDVHNYPQWDAPQVWRSELVAGPFISEWGTHAMPTPETYREILSGREAEAAIGPVLLKKDKKLMADTYPEIMYHWVEFQPDRLVQMLARGSAFDNLSAVPLDRFSEAIAAGASEFYKYSCEAARSGYPQNGGLLLWAWKRPWPNAGIQLVDGLGRPISVYYEVKRAFGSPWPCLKVPHLNYAVGDEVEMPSAVLSESARANGRRVKLTARLLGPDLGVRKTWEAWPEVKLETGAEANPGPTLAFSVPAEFARAFFFVVLQAADAERGTRTRNVYTFRCPPQLEDAAFRADYRAEAPQGLFLDRGPWLRPQVEKFPTTLALSVRSLSDDSPEVAQAVVEVTNVGRKPSVMTEVQVSGPVQVAASDAFFWMEPGETRRLALLVRHPAGKAVSPADVSVCAWNAAAAHP